MQGRVQDFMKWGSYVETYKGVGVRFAYLHCSLSFLKYLMKMKYFCLAETKYDF